MLFLIFIMTALFSELITNNGAVALMFPITRVTAGKLGGKPDPYVLALMVAAVLSVH